jgi:hypothetical protein
MDEACSMYGDVYDVEDFEWKIWRENSISKV